VVKLTTTYLAERRAAVHTDESFSKAVLEQALDAAQAKLGSGEADEGDFGRQDHCQTLFGAYRRNHLCRGMRCDSR